MPCLGHAMPGPAEPCPVPPSHATSVMECHAAEKGVKEFGVPRSTGSGREKAPRRGARRTKG